MSTKNLGLVKALHVGTTAPTNLQMLWYDDNVGQKIHKYYDTNVNQWVPIPGTSSLLFFPNATNFPVVGSAGIIYVDTAANISYIWDSINSIYVALDYWKAGTLPDSVYRNGRVGAGKDPVNFDFEQQGTSLMSRYDYATNEILGFINTQHLGVLDVAAILYFNDITTFNFGSSIGVVKPDGVGLTQPLVAIGAIDNTNLIGSTNILVFPNSIFFKVLDVTDSVIGFFQLDQNGNLIVSNVIQVGDLQGFVLPSAGMIRFNGIEFQGYNGSAWVPFDGSGIIPAGNNHEVLVRDASNTLVFTKTLKDSGGLDSIRISSRTLYSSGTNNVAIDWNHRVAYGHLNTGVGDDPRISWGGLYGNALFRTGGFIAVDWDSSYLFDVSGFISIDWNDRKVYNNSGAVILDWDGFSPRINNQYNLPITDGTAGQTITTDGLGNTTWQDTGLMSVKVTLSVSDIQNLDFLPKQLIPAPGAGKFIEVISCSGKLNWNSVAYDPTMLGVYYEASYTDYHYKNSEIIGSTTDFFQNFQRGVGDILENKAIVLKAFSSPGSHGDSTLDIYLTYKIMTL